MDIFNKHIYNIVTLFELLVILLKFNSEYSNIVKI